MFALFPLAAVPPCCHEVSSHLTVELLDWRSSHEAVDPVAVKLLKKEGNPTAVILSKEFSHSVLRNLVKLLFRRPFVGAVPRQVISHHPAAVKPPLIVVFCWSHHRLVLPLSRNPARAYCRAARPESQTTAFPHPSQATLLHQHCGPSLAGTTVSNHCFTVVHDTATVFRSCLKPRSAPSRSWSHTKLRSVAVALEFCPCSHKLFGVSLEFCSL